MTDGELKKIKHICFNCGAKSLRRDYSYTTWCMHNNRQKMFYSIIGDEAFFVCYRGVAHITVVAIAVLQGKRNSGIGSRMMRDIKIVAEEYGISKIRLRANIEEGAWKFYHKHGFVIVDTKGKDYEMEWNR